MGTRNPSGWRVHSHDHFERWCFAGGDALSRFAERASVRNHAESNVAGGYLHRNGWQGWWSMSAISIIARLTFREAIRRRIMLAGLVLGIAFVILFSIGTHFIFGD